MTNTANRCSECGETVEKCPTCERQFHTLDIIICIESDLGEHEKHSHFCSTECHYTGHGIKTGMVIAPKEVEQ